MTQKLFDRSAEIVVGTLEAVCGRASGGLRVSFSITKTLKSEPNTCSISLWNLKEDSRNILEQSFRGVPVAIAAGYQGENSQLFLGKLRKAYSETDGPDIITIIESGDGEEETQSTRVNVTVPANTPVLSVVKQIAKAMNLGNGNLEQMSYTFDSGSAVFQMGLAISGSAIREFTWLMRSLNLEWSIQDGAIQVLNRNKALEQEAIALDVDSGLLGSPSVDNEGLVSVSMLMLPDVFPGRKLVLVSRHASGDYRIEKAEYTGDTHGEDWRIDVEAKRL